MSIDNMILELVEEMTTPDEIFLDCEVQENTQLEDDILFGTAEEDDETIDFINSGKLGYEDPINFTDEDIYDALNDDEMDDC